LGIKAGEWLGAQPKDNSAAEASIYVFNHFKLDAHGRLYVETYPWRYSLNGYHVVKDSSPLEPRPPKLAWSRKELDDAMKLRSTLFTSSAHATQNGESRDGGAFMEGFERIERFLSPFEKPEHQAAMLGLKAGFSWAELNNAARAAAGLDEAMRDPHNWDAAVKLVKACKDIRKDEEAILLAKSLTSDEPSNKIDSSGIEPTATRAQIAGPINPCMELMRSRGDATYLRDQTIDASSDTTQR
jgi:hypothetical protein